MPKEKNRICIFQTVNHTLKTTSECKYIWGEGVACKTIEADNIMRQYSPDARGYWANIMMIGSSTFFIHNIISQWCSIIG